MRLKDRRRLVLALLVLVVLAGGAFAAVFVRSWQREGITSRYLEQARAAYDRGDFYSSLVDSGRFVSRSRKEDPRRADALLIYAESRAKITEPDGRHLREAASHLSQYVERRPDDAKSRQRLLALYNEAGLYNEARDLALRMLPPGAGKGGAEAKAALATLDDSSLPLLREAAQAMLRIKDSNRAVIDEMLQRMLAIAPLNLDANLLRLEFLTTGTDPAAARAMADALAGAHPDEPVAYIIAAIAPPDRDESPKTTQSRAISLLCAAAGLGPDGTRASTPLYTDPEIAERLASILERLGFYELSFPVIQDAADRLKDPEMERILVRRLWQEGQYADAERRLAGLDPNSLAVDSDLLGFRGLVLIGLGRSAEIEPIAKALEARQGDYRATAWAKVLPVAAEAAARKTVEPARIREAIAVLESAVKTTQAREPVFLVLLGDQQSLLAQTEEARQSWTTAAGSALAAAWPTPSLRIAESLLAEGRAEEATVAANRAAAIAPSRVGVLTVWFEAHAARLQKGSRAEPSAAAVLEELARTEEQLRESTGAGAGAALERLLPTRVLLLVRDGRSDEARKLVEATLALEKPPAAATLQRLARICAQEGLGLESSLTALAERVGGDNIEVTFTRALELASQGKTAEGLRLITDAAARAPAEATAQIAVVRYREQTGDPGVNQAWADLGSRFERDLAVQRTILASPVAGSDRALIERTVARYTALVGDAGAEDPLVAIAQSRALLASIPLTKNDRDRAVARLQAVVSAQPGHIEARLQLASALTLSDAGAGITPDYSRATAILNEAAALEPRSVTIKLNLAQLLQLQQQFGRARDALSDIALSPGVDTRTRMRAAELLLAQGDADSAITALREIKDKSGAQPDPRVLLMLGSAYATQGNEALATEVFEQLAAGLARDIETIYITARYFRSAGKPERAAAVLAGLDGLDLAPGVKEHARARWAAESSDPQAAALYEAALKIQPARADLWREYLAYQIREAYAAPEEQWGPIFAKAAKIGEQGLAATSQNPELRLLAEQVALLAARPDRDAAELLLTLPIDTGAAIVQMKAMADAVREAAGRNELSSAAALDRLAARFPSSAQFQLFVARRMFRLGAADRTANLVARARTLAPSDPIVARSAAQIYLALGRHSDMLAAAQVWRRADSRNPEADTAVAEAQLKLGRLDDCARTLEPRLAEATANPDNPNHLGVLSIHTRLLLAQKQAAAARERLRPLLGKSASVRRLIWLSAASTDLPLEEAEAWIQEARQVAPADDVKDQLAIVAAYTTLSARFPAQAEKLSGYSLDLLKSLAADPKTANALVLESLGKLQHSAKNLDEAAAAYRRAIELDPGRADAMNNLAAIIGDRGDIDGALALVNKSIGIAESPSNRDTLASIYAARAKARAAAGDRAAAEADFKLAAAAYKRVAELSPGNPSPLSSAAFAYEQAGATAEAAACYEALLAMSTLPPEQTALTKNNLAAGLSKLNRGKEDLDRAMTLIAEALQALPHPALYDTQGWILLQRGQVPDAAAAFRTAIEKAGDQGAPSARIGLATCLASGTSDQKREAAEQLRLVNPAGLGPEDKERFEKARAAAGS